jgi:hypothetical protein
MHFDDGCKPVGEGQMQVPRLRSRHDDEVFHGAGREQRRGTPSQSIMMTLIRVAVRFV